VIEIGLTGGIGSGKSTVAGLLVDHGAVLIDADAIVREVQVPGTPVFKAMVERFGPGIVAEDGTLDRAAVAAVVFADPDELKALNGIVHPAVTEEMTRRRESYATTDATLILDIPLLVESKYSGLAGVIVVDVDPEVAVERLVRYRGFSEDDARARISRQASREDRLAIADFVVDNSGDLASLRDEVDRCWQWVLTLPRPEPGAAVNPIRGRAQP
jgi:dephospho-CoA kinase